MFNIGKIHVLDGDKSLIEHHIPFTLDRNLLNKR